MVGISINTIVAHCAPTLAGHKIGSLFSCRFSNVRKLKKTVAEKNSLLNPKGVYFEILKISPERALIYVYRKEKLKSLLESENIQKFLRKQGYTSFELNNCIDTLVENLKKEEFPHEIGVFLNYPLNDIEAFIKNKGKNYKCVGNWKVYNDEDKAKETFALYGKCKRVYCQKLLEGLDIDQLTVVG